MGNEELSNYIAVNQNIRFGKPCIKGTRITVGDILSYLSSGMSVAEIAEDFPELNEKHIRAGLLTISRRKS
jgi:uncharacterized protein (DUF433 family)